MDFSSIVRRYAYIQAITWATTDVATATLATINVKAQTLISAGGCNHFTPLGFVNAYFSLWRGSIKYRFKIVKTGFHSGRLSFSFFPGDYATYTGNDTYVNRTIIDIRETTEFELTIPYIFMDAWRRQNQPTGLLYIAVVDPLVAPASVSPSITILVEVAGGADMEFAIPQDPQMNPTVIVPQAGEENLLIASTLGNASVDADPNLSSAVCIGDKLSSFRAYLHRYMPITPSANAGGLATLLNSAKMRFHQDAIFALAQTSPATYYNADTFSIVASCYGIVRGGIRVRDVINTGMIELTARRTNPSPVTAATVFFNSGAVSSPLSPENDVVDVNFTQNQIWQDYNLNKVLSIELPQNSQSYGRAKSDIICYQGDATSTGTITYSAFSSQSRLVLEISLPVATTTALTLPVGQELHNIYRSVADDADFSVFISIPPMKSRSVTDGRMGLY